MLASFLESKPEFQEEVKEFFRNKPPTADNLENARKMKNLLRKKATKKDATDEDKAKANQALRNYNYLLNLERTKDAAKKAKNEEKAFKKNFYKTAKEITNGTFGEDKVIPTFNAEKANDFYKNRYSEPVIIDPARLVWFPKVDLPETPYCMSAYRPKDIKEALRRIKYQLLAMTKSCMDFFSIWTPLTGSSVHSSPRLEILELPLISGVPVR